MADLEGLADQGTPLLADLGAAAPALDGLIKGLGHRSPRPSRESLPEPRRRARARPPGADPRAAADPGPAAASAQEARAGLRRTSTTSPQSLDETDGIERINDFLFYLALTTTASTRSATTCAPAS